MFSFDKFKEHAHRVLSIPSHSESGNEELVRYLSSLMHDFGFKPQLQQVNHSLDGLSKRQYNLIGFSSTPLVDRTTRRGALFINPLDVTTGNRPQLWTATQGNPHAPVVNERGIIGAGALQGKLDFLCRIYGALELVDRRHKNPIYLVGTCASHYGMMGSRYLIESLSVNPKEVYSFSPTQLLHCKQAAGQASYTIDVDSSAKDRDSRGYNRCVEITAFGVSLDFASSSQATNAFELLMDVLLDAASNGFDFQWANLETDGAEGANPDLAKAQIFLTAFQFEDFKQFIKNKLDTPEKQRFFRIEYTGVTEGGTSFIPSELIEVILELDFEWKNFIQNLNLKPNPAFVNQHSVGGLARVRARGAGKFAVTFELRYLPNHSHKELDEQWKTTVKKVSENHKNFHFQLLRNYLVQGVQVEQSQTTQNSNYLSDAGWFDKSKFPVTILGVGAVESLPKGPNESIQWAELEKAIAHYRDLMTSVSNG